MIVIMVVMLAFVFTGGHDHMGMMGHGNATHEHSTSSNDQQGAASEHQH